MAFDRFDNFKDAGEGLRSAHAKMSDEYIKGLGRYARNHDGPGTPAPEAEAIPGDLAADWHAKMSAGETPVSPAEVLRAKGAGGKPDYFVPTVSMPY